MHSIWLVYPIIRSLFLRNYAFEWKLKFESLSLFVKMIHDLDDFCRGLSRCGFDYAYSAFCLLVCRIPWRRERAGKRSNMLRPWRLHGTSRKDQDPERFCSQGADERAYGEFHLYIIRHSFLFWDAVDAVVGISSYSTVLFLTFCGPRFLIVLSYAFSLFLSYAFALFLSYDLWSGQCRKGPQGLRGYLHGFRASEALRVHKRAAAGRAERRTFRSAKIPWQLFLISR